MRGVWNERQTKEEIKKLGITDFILYWLYDVFAYLYDCWTSIWNFLHIKWLRREFMGLLSWLFPSKHPLNLYVIGDMDMER